jgi:predicted transcriptional regulator
VPGELVPRKITREQLERIIQRAAELQAGEMDTGEGISEQDLLKLGSEVGIPGRFLRQAMYEEAAGGAALEHGFVSRWVGPKMLLAHRVVPGDKAVLEQAISQFMTEEEAMTPKRRLPDRTVWERQKGLFAEMKRGLSLEGKAYHLARALDVSVQLNGLEDGYCHAELAADVRNLREQAVAGIGVLGAAGAVGSVVLALIPGLALIAFVPLLGALGLSGLAARTHRAKAQRMQVALEQVLDRLERGEIRPKPQMKGPRASAFMRIASEIKRSVEDVADTFRQPPGSPPPSGTNPPGSSPNP